MSEGGEHCARTFPQREGGDSRTGRRIGQCEGGQRCRTMIHEGTAEGRATGSASIRGRTGLQQGKAVGGGAAREVLSKGAERCEKRAKDNKRYRAGEHRLSTRDWTTQREARSRSRQRRGLMRETDRSSGSAAALHLAKQTTKRCSRLGEARLTGL